MTVGTTPADVTISGVASVCEGQTGVSYSVPATAGSSYSWSVPTGATIVSGASGPENNTIVVDFGTSSGQVKVVETNSGGCKGKEAVLDVTVVALPQAFTLVASEPTTFCEGSTGSTLGLNGSQSGITYELLFNGSVVATAQGTGAALAFGAFNQAGSYTARAFVTASASCTAPMSGSVSLTTTTPPTLSATTTEASCASAADGAINLTITGGTAPINIVWSTNETTEDISGLTAGVYTVKVSDGSGCSVNLDVEVKAPAALALSAIPTNVSCFEGNDGAINLTVTGGTAPYRFTWSTLADTEDISGLVQGTYRVDVVDAKGCTISGEYSITQPTQLTASIVQTQQISCAGGNDGALDLSVAGGTAPYTYQWSNNATTEDVSSVGAGTHSVTVTDNKGCKTTASITITAPDAVVLTYTVANATTCGGSEGSIDLSVSGGTGTYTYEWSNGSTTQDVTALTARTYTVTVKDGNNCSATASIEVGQPAGISAVSGTLTQVSCKGANNGAIVLSVSGGTANYTYSWSNGAITKDVAGLAPGNYSVTVTDANLCAFTQQFTITEPEELRFNAAAQTTNILCAGAATGAIDISVAGGTAPYTYSWTNTTAVSQDLIGVVAGTYQVTVRDARGCTITSEAFTLTQPTAISASSTTVAVTCFGGSDGSVNLSVSGGAGSYKYLWSNGAVTEDLSGVAAGTYTVTITDANNCSITASATVSQPALLEAVTSGTATICEGTSTGWVRVDPRGGVAPYTIVWGNGETSSRINNLPAGTYTVTVTDANGCKANGSYTITEPNMLVDLGADVTACTGQSVTLKSGHNGGNNTVLWSTGQTTPNINVTTSGTYWVKVTDPSDNCEGYDEVVVTFIPNEPVTVTIAPSAAITCHTTSVELGATATNAGATPTYQWTVNGVATGGNTSTLQLASFADGDVVGVQVTPSHNCSTGPATASYTLNTKPGLTLSATIADAKCFGEASGAIDLTVTGGTGTYSYSWSTTATTQDVTGLAAGEYTITVSDQAGCSQSATYTVGEPLLLQASAAATNISSCTSDNGAIVLTVTGGSTEYTYSWSNGATTKDLSGLAEGTYTVTVTDANGCTATAEATIARPAALSLTTTATALTSCGSADGSIDLVVSGGTAPYEYAWSNGAATEDVSGLAANTYTVTVTDAGGCTATAEVVIEEPAGISLTASVQNTTACQQNDGGINLTVSGGEAPYTYSWNEGAFTTEDLSGLLAGTYTIYIEDVNGCTATATYTVADGNGPTITATVQDANCFGEASGSISLVVNGGSAPYSYLWNDAAASTSQDLSDLVAGSYTVTVTDDKGCIATATITVGEATAISITAAATNLSSCTSTDGAVVLTVEGGTGAYTYEWNNGTVTKDLSGLAAGEYTVTVTDEKGCTATATATVSAPAAITLTTDVTNTSLCGQSNGAIELTVSGGAAPYTYSWNEGEFTTEDLSNLPMGEYTVVVTDAGGCTGTATVTIRTDSGFNGLTANVTEPSCFGGNDGAIELVVDGGTAPLTYSWNHGPTTKDVSGLVAGRYDVTITDVNNCFVTQTIFVGQPSEILMDADVQNTTACAAADGALDLRITGGTEPYTYRWSNGATTQSLTALVAGTYTVTATDKQGCTATATFAVSDGTAPSLTANVIEPGCFGTATGAIELAISGGTAPYTYAWSNSATTQNLSDLSAGIYSVEVTDARGCMASLSITLAEPAELQLAADVRPTTACGAADGSIGAEVRGGTAPYTYLWNNGETSESISALVPGAYSLTVTDARGCTITRSYSISDPAGPAVTAVVQNIDCSGNTSGAINLSVTGGTSPYTFAWSNGATTEDLSDLVAADYDVTITDAAGCRTNMRYTIRQTSGFTASATATAATCATAADGRIDMATVGGEAPFTYTLYVAGNDAAVATTTNAFFADLSAGTYRVVISDAANCATEVAVTIAAPEALAATISGTTSLCAGVADGSLSVAVSGGTAPYSYLWNTTAVTESISGLTAGDYTVTVTDASNCSITVNYTIAEEGLVVNLGNDQALCAPATATLVSGFDPASYSIRWSTGTADDDKAEITVSTTGTYWVEVTDRTTACVGRDEVLVEIENEFEAAVAIRPVDEVTCNSQTVVLEAVPTYGGTAPSFQWWNAVTGEALGTAAQLSLTTINNGDMYMVEMTSSLDCATPNTVSAIYQIMLPAVEAPALTSSEENVCLGSTLPTIRDVNGGSMRWYYNPNGEPMIDPAMMVYEGTDFVPSSELGVGTHKFLVTQNTLLCGESLEAVAFTLTLFEGDCEPEGCEVTPAVAIQILPGKDLCSDITTLQLQASLEQVGENPGYAWYYNGTLFSNDATPSFTAAAGFTTGDEFRLEVTITDPAFICEGRTTVTALETIRLVEDVQATASIRPIEGVCAESATPVLLFAEGTYIDWRFADKAAVYTWYINDVEVKREALEGDASTAAQLEIVPNQLPANAQVRLVVSLPEGTSCVLAPAAVEYAIPYATPSAPVVSLSSNAPAGACPGTAITFTANATNAGTNPIYTFLLDGAEVQSGTSANYVLAAPQSGQRVVVKVKVANATGLCLSTDEATSAPQDVRVLTSEECVGGGFNCGVFGAELTSFVRPSCGERNGALYYRITGGAKPYFVEYAIAGDTVQQSINEDSFTLAIEKVPAGWVYIGIRDSRGRECKLNTILEQAPRLNITFEKTADGDILCYGTNTGKARLTVSGGNAPYQYLIEGTTEWQTLNGNTRDFTDLPAGLINILVRDNENDTCPDVKSIEIKHLNPEVLISTTIVQQANCTDKIGSFRLETISGGSTGNGYKVKLSTEESWKDFVPGMEFNGLSGGRHTLLISDGVCEHSKSVIVPAPGLIALSSDSRVEPFSCERPELRSGLYLKIDATVTEVTGSFIADFYLQNSAGTYDLVASEQVFNGNGELYKFQLERGTYKVTVRAQNGQGCPTEKVFVIEGSEVPVPITFTAVDQSIYCADATGGVLITDLKGAPGLKYEVEFYDADGNLALSKTITTFEYATQESFEIMGLPKGLYRMLIKQDQGLCNNIESSRPFELLIRETDKKLAASVLEKKVSFPDRATGSLTLRVANGSGTAPYTASLVWLERVEEQEDWAFESYGDPVPYNNTTGKYDLTYNNLPPGIYELTVTDAKGCSVVIRDTIMYDTNLFIPNIITPNGDGSNEVFYIRNKPARTQLTITNRWGKVVYETTDYKNDWDGGELPEGIYFYSIKAPQMENGIHKGWLEIRRGARPN